MNTFLLKQMSECLDESHCYCLSYHIMLINLTKIIMFTYAKPYQFFKRQFNFNWRDHENVQNNRIDVWLKFPIK